MSSTTIPPDDPDYPDDLPGKNPDDDNGAPRRGRPTKLTPEVAEAVVRLHLTGQFRSVVCRNLGIGPRTFLRWMRNGRWFQNGVYANFYRAVVMAEADVEARAVSEVLAAGRDGDTKYLGLWLQWKYPQRYGPARDDLVEVRKRLRDLEREVQVAVRDARAEEKSPAAE